MTDKQKKQKITCRNKVNKISSCLYRLKSLTKFSNSCLLAKPFVEDKTGMDLVLVCCFLCYGLEIFFNSYFLFYFGRPFHLSCLTSHVLSVVVLPWLVSPASSQFVMPLSQPSLCFGFFLVLVPALLELFACLDCLWVYTLACLNTLLVFVSLGVDSDISPCTWMRNQRF